jgi:hypothetical protein
MIILPITKKLFVDKVTGKPISKSKYTSMMHKKMQKMGIPTFFTAYSLKHVTIKKLAKLAMNSTVALSHYSPLAAKIQTEVIEIIRKNGFSSLVMQVKLFSIIDMAHNRKP